MSFSSARRRTAGRSGRGLAFRLGAGLAQDCIRVGLDADSGRVVATRPVYGGSAMAAVTFPGDGPQVVVMRGRAYEPPSHGTPLGRATSCP